MKHRPNISIWDKNSMRPTRKRTVFLRYLLLFVLVIIVSNSILKLFFLWRTRQLTCAQLCPYSSVTTRDSIRFNDTYTIQHFPDFVCPQNFRNLADWVFGWPDQFNEKILIGTQQGQFIAPCLPPGSIIYVRTGAIDQFFKEVYPYLQNNFVLITGEGDLSSPNKLECLNDPDSKIIHWFGQNGQIDVSVSKKFTHIPIGINCYEMAHAIEHIYAQHSNSTVLPVFNEHDEPKAYIQPIDVSQRALRGTFRNDSLLLINFNTGTDRTRLRWKIWKSMCLPKYAKNFTFGRCIGKYDGVQINDLSRIYQRNRQYPFWLSPRGNGIDCHRTWEALYLDVIPIVWNSSLNVLYENLPVVIINDHKELDTELLYTQLNEISKKKLSSTGAYTYEKLRNAYWRRLILDKSRYRGQNDLHLRSDRCWSAHHQTAWTLLLSFLF